ncbi:MAG: hypothetical protein R3C56_36420 [Pirellulaceae bacterium]
MVAGGLECRLGGRLYRQNFASCQASWQGASKQDVMLAKGAGERSEDSDGGAAGRFKAGRELEDAARIPTAERRATIRLRLGIPGLK